jgi:hypothetical protein
MFIIILKIKVIYNMATVLRVAMKLEVCFILKERGRGGELRWRQKQVISLSAAAAAFSLLLSGRRRGQQKKLLPPPSNGNVQTSGGGLLGRI